MDEQLQGLDAMCDSAADRLFDMMPTSTNGMGAASCAVIVNKILEQDAEGDP